MTTSDFGKAVLGRAGLDPLMVDVPDYLQSAKNLAEKVSDDTPFVQVATLHALIAIAEQGLPTIEEAARADDRPPAGAMYDPLDRFKYCVEFGSSDDLHRELAAEVERLRAQVARVRHLAESTGDRVWAQRIFVALAVHSGEVSL